MIYISWCTGALSLSVVLSLMQMEEMEEEKTSTSVSSRLSSQPLLWPYCCVYVRAQSVVHSDSSGKVRTDYTCGLHNNSTSVC